MVSTTAKHDIGSMVTGVQVKARSSVQELEALIAGNVRPDGGPDRRVDLRLASSGDAVVLGDIWAAILLGTLSRDSDLRLLGWGLKDVIEPDSKLAVTPAFLVALTMAASIAAGTGPEVDRAAFRKLLALTRLGLVDPTSGASQTLVEFDPEYSVAPTLRGGTGFSSVSPLDRKRIFEQVVMRFRSRLEIGAIRHGVTPGNAGPAGDIGNFLRELHDNGSEHGTRGVNGRTLNQTRFMRLRKHVANRKAMLVERCSDFTELARHVNETFSDASSTPALIEASVSDFGPGIVDGFLSSDAGRRFANVNRRELLEALIYDRLTSKSSDASAGLGLQHALLAARRMGAFVSLRTGEFWLVVSFASENGDPKLRDISNGVHSKVAGTHWQILWAQS
ncbi:hypothetical protein ACC713_20195 [Rhizobium johnstonii]|uniref:hypothetical protein n=1 Tax=Rhizobium johnstonii TaxID=3019933 RepID=UPI003F94DA46